MSPALVVAVAVLASYRLTRLVVADSIAARPRSAVWRRFPPESHPLGYLLTCPFCAGAWLSAATIAAGHAVGLARWPWKFDLIIFWAVAGGQALLSAAEGRLER